jgi:isopenicillin N synthase-like dioxygenase
LHRVVNPPLDAGASARRQSLVFFHNPNYDAEISCIPTVVNGGELPKYAPTTSGDYLRSLFCCNTKRMRSVRKQKLPNDVNRSPLHARERTRTSSNVGANHDKQTDRL